MKEPEDEELKEGAEEEKEEHEVSEKKAEEIAKDHLRDDSEYYDKMEFMKKYPKALEHFMMAVKCAKGE
jgi:hypothetical protein